MNTPPLVTALLSAALLSTALAATTPHTTVSPSLLPQASLSLAVTAGSPPPAVVRGTPALVPEGADWDPHRRAFVVGSALHGTVSLVDARGRVRTLASPPGLVSTFGVRVDAARQRLLAAYSDPGMGTASAPATRGRLSGLAIMDLRSGRLLRKVPLDLGPGPHGANDVALDPAGRAYVTDSLTGTVYRVDLRGRVSVVVRDGRLAGTGGAPGLNGVVWHPDGHLIVGQYGSGRFYRVFPHSHRRVGEVALDGAVVGADGMTVRPDGSLLVVANALAAPDGRAAVWVLESEDGWRTAHVECEAGPWTDAAPTAAVPTPYGVYVLDGGLDALGGPEPAGFVLRRFGPPE
ncbi:SMP-30/gluconolactonase/LRE family protein [Streptomyces amakusaensis]|uniref:SMP-30/Gluconolactonase/LRE-like region domain-containing protein n=1 Tax=Streptomyces amakusaensis TaxID=67271 RepID=A0ABW0AF22_9ACTN